MLVGGLGWKIRLDWRNEKWKTHDERDGGERPRCVARRVHKTRKSSRFHVAFTVNGNLGASRRLSAAREYERARGKHQNADATRKGIDAIETVRAS